jgi:hypothetical protein
VHPIWRGIGCVFMVLIPFISYAAGVLTVDFGLAHNWPIPYQLLRPITFPDWLYKSSAVAQLLGYITSSKNFYAFLAYASAAVVYMILLGGVLSVVNAFVYQVIGPPRWGPQDVPPPKIKTKAFKR